VFGACFLTSPYKPSSPTFPSLQWSLFYPLLLWHWPFWVSEMSENMQFLSFCTWITSFNVRSTSSNCVAANDRISLFFQLNNILLCICTIFSLSTHLLVDNISCLLWILLQSTWECRWLWHNDYIPFGYIYILVVELLGDMVVMLFLLFWDRSCYIAWTHNPPASAFPPKCWDHRYTLLLTDIFSLVFLKDSPYWFP
jgi:hypothetical protein